MSEEAPNIARIHEAYHGEVLTCAARLIGGDEAEDVAQEVFIKINRSLGTLGDPSELSPATR